MTVPATPEFDVSVIVVNYNTAHLLHEMFAALDAARGPLKLQVIVIDNASRDDSVAVMRRDFADIQLIVNESNVGFGRANNQALPFLNGRHVLLLNTDAFVSADTLGKTVEYLDTHPDCGILGVRLTGRDGELQPSCRYAPTLANTFLSRTGLTKLFPRVRLVDDMAWDHQSVRECDWVPGCYYLVRREVIDQVGLFDPRFFLYYEEVDHCRRAQAAGWKIVFYPFTSVVHIGGESAKSVSEITSAGRQISALQIESELLYFRKHHGLAGAIANVLLASVADAVLALKAILKLRGLNPLKLVSKHLQTVWSLVARTRFGARPTR